MTGTTNHDDDADFLSGALHGAADAMPGGDVDEVHLQFGPVRDRVRRRRTAKAGGVGAAALVVAGALALGAAQWTALDEATPIPADPSPSTTAPSPTPSPGAFAAGYLPADIYEGTDLACGAEVGPETVGGEFGRGGEGIRFDGEPYAMREGGTDVAYAGLVVRDDAQQGPGVLDLPPGMVWTRDGRIVRLTPYFDAEPADVEFDASGEADTAQYLRTSDTCRPPEGAQDVPSSQPVEYEQVLAPGEYRVYPILWTDITAGAAEYVSGEAITVDVGRDGMPTGLAEAPSTAPPDPPSGEDGPPSPDAGEQGDPGAGGDTGPGAGTGDGDGQVVPGDPGDDGAGGTDPGDGSGTDPEPEPECSATGLTDTSDFSFEPAPVARTGQALVDAALACDVSGVEAASTPGVTQLHRNAAVSVAERFALPEQGDDVYAKLATLLGGTGVVDPATGDHVWPTVASAEYRDDDVAWEHAVGMGYATQEQADRWRAAGEYYGWRVSISPDGTWRTFLPPDDAAG